MITTEYPRYLDRFPKQVDKLDGTPNATSEDLNIIQDAIMAIQSVLGVLPQGDKETVKERLESLERFSSPFNLVTRQTTDGDEEYLEISWSYSDSEDIEHFILEVFNEETGEYEPYDGESGIIEK